MSIFLYYLLEVYFILIDILYKLHPLLVGQLTHEKILICLIFPLFSAIFAQVTIFWNAHRLCQQYSNIINRSLYHVYSFVPLLFLIFTVLYIAPIPVELRSFQQNPVESSGVQCHGTGFQWIPQDFRLKLK